MKIAIFRDDGIGDLIVSTPLIENLLKQLNVSIDLYCSIRNVEYSNLLKKDKKISNYYVIPNKYSLRDKVILGMKIRNSKYDSIYILSPKNINYIYAKISGSKNIYGIVMINTGKNNLDRYRPVKFLITYLLNKHEIIDCRKDFKNSYEITFTQHYLNLFKSSLPNYTSKLITSYYKPNLSLELNTINHFMVTNKIDNFVIIHLDEKWLRSEWKDLEILNLVKDINSKTKRKIIITEGLIRNSYNNYIKKNLNFKKLSQTLFNSDVFMSEDTGVYLIDSINTKNLISLVAKSCLVIQKHGGLVHIASSFNIPVVDIIYPGTEKFLKKWRPNSKQFIQITNNGYIGVTSKIVDFMQSILIRN